MSIITISRGSYSRGQEVGEKVAARLGYECVSREFLLEASEDFNIPEIKLVHAIRDVPSILDRFFYGKEKYIAFIQAEVLRHLRKDGVVYCGLAGHFFVRNIRHVLQVRILADFDYRVKYVMERDRISAKEATRLIGRNDKERRKWGKRLYGIDPSDPSLYDLVIHIDKVTVDDAVDIICNTVSLEHFQPTPESRIAMEDLAIAADVKAALVKLKPDVKVQASHGIVRVQTSAVQAKEQELIQELETTAKSIPGVVEAEIQVHWRHLVD